jgi:hypothetical protein
MPKKQALAALKAALQDSPEAANEFFKKKFTPGFYHGSPSNKIKAFDPSKGTKPEEWYTPGVTFVTKDVNFAHDYVPNKATIEKMVGQPDQYMTGATIYPLSVNLGKHFNPHTPEGKQVIADYVAKKYRNAMPDELEIKTGDYIDRLTDPINTWGTTEHPQFLQHLRDTGHDTFAVTEAGVHNVGVFEPHNIRGKFAKFDPEEAMNPDFMKAEGGAIQHFAKGKSAIAENIGKGTLELLGKTEKELLSARDVFPKHPQQQNPILAKAVDAYRTGKISHDELQEIIAKTYRPNILGAVPDRLSPYDIAVTVGPGKAKKGIVDYNVEIPEGARYTTRLDIPGNEATGRNVGSIVLPSGKTVYGQAEHLGDVDFGSDPTKAMRVALGTKAQGMTPGAAEYGAPKSPFAVVGGTNLATDPDEIRRAMQFYTGAPEWKEIGMNPYAHSQFFDKRTMQPAWNSDEVLKYGNYVLAKDPELTHWLDPRLAVDAEKVGGVPNLKFADGGPITADVRPIPSVNGLPGVGYMQAPAGALARLQVQQELADQAKLRAAVTGTAMALPGQHGVKTMPGQMEVGYSTPSGLDINAFRTINPIPGKGHIQGLNARYTMKFKKGGKV